MVRQSSAQDPGAFTLIELLVVVGIIALLVAILIPAIPRARQIAEQVVCSGHLNQFGLAFHQFADDHNGVLPGKAGPVDWAMGLNGTRIDFAVNSRAMAMSFLATVSARRIQLLLCDDKPKARKNRPPAHLLTA